MKDIFSKITGPDSVTVPVQTETKISSQLEVNQSSSDEEVPVKEQILNVNEEVNENEVADDSGSTESIGLSDEQ